MIKRDFTTWDFVKQEPKKQGFTIDGNYTFDTITIDTSDWIISTASLDVSTDMVYISDLTVQGSAVIPPQEGQMRYNVDSRMTEVYHQDEWLEIGYTHEIHSEPKISIWSRFKTWLDKITTRPYRGHYEI